MTDGELPPPQWAPDPTEPGKLRYWDGKAWTEHQADGLTPPTVPTPPRNNRGRLFVGIGIAGLVLFGIAAATGDTDDREDQRPVVNNAPSCDQVTYVLEGSAERASLTMATPTGTEQRTVFLPRTIDAGCFTPSEFTYVSAQNEGESGSVKCTINRGGRVVSTATSSGAYVIATCSD